MMVRSSTAFMNAYCDSFVFDDCPVRQLRMFHNPALLSHWSCDQKSVHGLLSDAAHVVDVQWAAAFQLGSLPWNPSRKKSGCP